MTESHSTGWIVFISHSSIDTWVVKQIAREIESCGAMPFLDEENIAVGEDFEERILDALDQARELLVLITPWSLDRLYVWAEIGAAWGRRIPIIGVLHGITAADVQSNVRVPLFFKRRDFIDINEIDTYFDQLRLRVETGN
ncbi:MAG: toll/interleukin-1 receptor domain-containing protein [Nitrososphaera sp.]|nr:toll/interleukin-1 receptor domain-containing protein [Nitrososphaera sp.]